QTTARSAARQQTPGAGPSLCVPPLCYGASTASASYANAKVQGEHSSVAQQSGIKAGDQGFQLQVNGSTDLKGGVISSTQAAVDHSRNSLTTATLIARDLHNKDDFKASAISVAGIYSRQAGA